jgi:transcriptional regulator with XRE-family HTH domain
MDVALVLRQRREQLDLEQRNLAAAAQRTESYISQLLSRRKAPPALGGDGYLRQPQALLEDSRRRIHAQDRTLRRPTTREEINFLQRLRFSDGRRPIALDYDWEL